MYIYINAYLNLLDILQIYPYCIYATVIDLGILREECNVTVQGLVTGIYRVS